MAEDADGSRETQLGFAAKCHLAAQMTVHISCFKLGFSERDLPDSI